MNTKNGWDHEPEVGDDIEALAGALLSDPWDDPHDIEYWLWNGERLVPASPSARATLQEMEHAQWEHAQRHSPQRRRIFVSLTRVIARWRLLWGHSAQPVVSSHRQQESEG